MATRPRGIKTAQGEVFVREDRISYISAVVNNGSADKPSWEFSATIDGMWVDFTFEWDVEACTKARDSMVVAMSGIPKDLIEKGTDWNGWIVTSPGDKY